jgi:hypothetical protein
MDEPTPDELKENPHLATLSLLDAAMLMTTLSLVALYPSSYGDDSDLEVGELGAYADAIIGQIQSLEWTLQSYRKSLKQSLHRTVRQKQQTCEEEFYISEIPL